MEKCRRNGILCVFALVCVAILLSTSLIVLAGNDNGTNRSVSSYKLESCMHVDKNRYIVAVYDESQEFVGEKEMLGERIPSDKEIDVGRLTYETHDDHELSLVDYDGGYRNIVVPDVVLYNGETWFVTEIAEWGLSTQSVFGRHPHTVEIGPSIKSLGARCLSFEFKTGCSDPTTEFSIRKIDESKLVDIGTEAFYETKIKSIELPKSLMVIGKRAFGECSVEKVILHSEVLSIQSGAFKNSGLEEINLENVVNIYEDAFLETDLSVVDLSSVRSIDNRAFSCENLSYVKLSSALWNMSSESFGVSDWWEFDDFTEFEFYDANNAKLDVCAEELRGKTFVREDTSTLDFIQVL